MSVFKNSFSVAAVVYPSDTVNIPYPNEVKIGTVTSISPNTRLIDSTQNFITSGIKVGDTVFNTTNQTYAYVVGVYTTYLILSENIFTAIGQSYSILQGENNGCYLYIGGTSSGSGVEVETIGGNIISFSGVNAGQVLPIQVKKVFTSSTADLIIALW